MIANSRLRGLQNPAYRRLNYQKSTQKGWIFVVQSINYLFFFSARAFGDSIKPFFFKVRSAEVETLHFTFWPLMTNVRFDTFGLNTLRVCLCENDTLWPYILPLPVISQIAILFLLYRINNCFKRLRIINREISQNFTVQIDTFGLHSSNQL